MTSSAPTTHARRWHGADDCRLEDFRAVVERDTDPAECPRASSVEQNVPIYDGGLVERIETPAQRRDVQGELAHVLLAGPGILAFRGAFEPTVIDGVSEEFDAMIAEQRASGAVAGDHFAVPGANDRVWGALDKLALRAPDAFADYYGNDVLALVCEAWLGPGYQVTSQVNVVNPGGRAQVAHVDYHLGFMSAAQAGAYPAHVHRLSPVLTLQGAVAHCDMPVETGPTMYLPFSQRYPAGYLACHTADFVEYFDQRFVQLPLAKGDAVFFNPSLFHAAGANRTTDVRRMANLLQVSSAFGRAMERVDRTSMAKALFPVLARRRAAGEREATLRNVVAAFADGYAFPTNLDRDPPIGGLAPETQADLVWRALEAGWDAGALAEQLDAQAARRRAASVG